MTWGSYHKILCQDFGVPKQSDGVVEAQHWDWVIPDSRNDSAPVSFQLPSHRVVMLKIVKCTGNATINKLFLWGFLHILSSSG